MTCATKLHRILIGVTVSGRPYELCCFIRVNSACVNFAPEIVYLKVQWAHVTLRALWALVKSAGSDWSDRNAPRLGAALAYYALLSMAPLMVLILAICGLVLNKNVAEARLLQQVQDLTGPSGAKTVSMLIDSTHKTSSGVVATCVALITLLFGASGVFVELRESLNIIWDAPKRRASTWRSMVGQRLVSFGMVLCLGVLLLASLLLSAVLTFVQKFLGGFVPIQATVTGEVLNFVISLIAISVLFGLIFKFVPDVPIDWRDVGIGAVATAVLFAIGKALLALYIGTAGVGSTYGAAGSLIALVVWVYYSAQIFFFGAVFTRVYADTYGSRSQRARLEKRPRTPEGTPSPKSRAQRA